MLGEMFQKGVRVKKKSMLKNGSYYMLGEVFQRGVTFLTIPIFTNLMAPNDYGSLSVYMSLISMLTVLLGLNFHVPIRRKYYEKTNKKEFNIFVNSIINYVVLNILLIIGFTFILKKYILIAFNLDIKLLLFGITSSIFSISIQYYLEFLQASKQSLKFVKISVSKTTLQIMIAIILMMNMKKDLYYGRIYGLIIINIIYTIYSLCKIYTFGNFRIRKKDIKYSLLIGVPLIPHAVSHLILGQSDRLILNQIKGSYEVGIYSFAYNLGMIITVINVSLSRVYEPFFYKNYQEKNLKIIKKVSKKFLKINCFIAIGIILFSKEVIKIIAPLSYLKAIEIIPIIILSYVLLFVYMFYINYAHFYKKTIYISIFTFISAGINIVLNYMFIPKFGYIAAAGSTLICYFLLTIFHYINSKFVLKAEVTPLSSYFIELFILIIGIVLYYGITYQIRNLILLFGAKMFILVISGFIYIYLEKNKIK